MPAKLLKIFDFCKSFGIFLYSLTRFKGECVK